VFEYIKDLIDPPIKNHRIFFFHIAKCGGTSVANAIINGYKPWRPAHVNTVVTLDEEAARFADENTTGNGHHVRRDLLNYMMSLPQVKCISGHFQYSNIAHEVYGDQWEFVTVLRNPIDRWFSHYNYNIREGASPKYKIKIPLDEFVETSLAASFGRAFVDEVTEDVDKKNIGIEELCERAIERYKRFSLIGTIENTAGFTRKFEEKFGHKLNIKHLNKAQMPENKKHRNISGDVLQRISELCEPDIYLYKELTEFCFTSCSP
jgi:hypothetical protein